ncbi:hypothetical protein [Candidatus Sneabacter namystus]|uniref:Uncharacterized protein n=1 Tax=Candidatus Sneabacter namystus TaxID=2601646 RepID=A0A5C0UGZ6_9RICK|nr:hypothetical protein [Candidatus Sneabacter namystus]QEK39405.1 hypothetical protein FZC37_00405 [Candidatus Sneabacter namystus]
MILVLHNNDLGAKNFEQYLEKNKIHYVSISLQDIVKDTKIFDTFSTQTSKCIWKFKECEIDFDNVSGIYNCISYLTLEHLIDFTPEDRHYVKNEWWAYLIYRINNSHNVINPISEAMSSGMINQFPFIYNNASTLGFKTPKYYISQSTEELLELANDLQRYISKSITYFDNSFRESSSINDDTISLIEYLPGNILYVHLIDEQIWCSIYKNGTVYQYEMDKANKDRCYKMALLLGIRKCEFIFKQEKDGNLALYYVSAHPNLSKAHESYIEQIYKTIYEKLSSSK